MATYTINTANTNIDTLATKTGADTYNINGGQLIIDQDSRYGVEANTSATLGVVTVSSTLGGDFVVDGRYIRLIPYNTGSGNVPVYNTTITQGSASGKLIGVYSALNVAPTTPGSAMPASGYIKIKAWNSTAYAAGALTGISANATGADVVGWIEVVGNEQSTSAGVITFNGLGNQSLPQFRGAQYVIGTTPTTPARTDTYQIPTNGNTCYMPGVWVEKSAGSEDYEFYATTTSNALVADVATDRRRGKYCWVSTGGVLRFGHDGTNSTGGYVPPANCKIMTGNIFLTMAPTATPTVNSLNATATTRYRLGGVTLANLTMNSVTCNWYLPLSAYGAIELTNYCSFVGPSVITQAGEETIINKCGWGAPVALISAGAVDFVQCAYGANITESYITYGVFGASQRSIFRTNLSRNITAAHCEFGFTGTRPATTNYGMSFLSGPNIDVQDCIIAGTISHTLGANISFTGNNEFWFDHASIVNTGTNITYLFNTNTSNNVLVEDITFPIAGQLPRAGLYTVANGVRNTFRNIGEYNTPIDFTLYTEEDAAWSRSGTTATVITASPHGMSTGHRILVYRSDNSTAITLAAKDITVTGANTFTFTCVNSGSTSGLLTFYGSCYGSAVMFDVQQTNTEDTKTHNVHFRGSMGAIWTINATCIDTEFKNISIEQKYYAHTAIAGTNTVARSIQIGAMASSASATLGTHWEDVFLREEGTPDAIGVSWSRASGVITVTSSNHGLITGDYVQIYGSDDATGARNNLVTITVINKDTFTYAGAASGTSSGILNYRIMEGVMMVQANAPSSTTASQAVITSGTPAFTGQSSLAMFTVGDQVYFETPDFILGHDAFAVAWPIVASSGGSPRTNVDVEYQIDRGSGWSSWKNMHVKRTSGAGTSGASIVTINDTTGIAVNDYVWLDAGIAGVGAEAKVVSVDSSTQLTLSVANTATFSGATLSFGQHPNETSFPSTGIKLRIRLTTITAFTNAITDIKVFTKTTSTSRNRLYPQDVYTVSFTLSGLPTGATVALYDNTDTLLQRKDNITSGEFVYEYVHSGTDFEDNYYVIWHEDYVPYKSDLFDLTATDLGLSYTPVDDAIYDAAHDDRYTIDFANKRIIMDTGENTYDVVGAYSHWKDQILLSNNFIYDFAFGIIGNVTYNSPKRIPAFTELLNNWKIRPDEADHTLIVENGILYATGGADPFVDTLGAYTVRIIYSQPVEVLSFNSGSGVTPIDKTEIIEGVWSYMTAAANIANSMGELVNNIADDADTAANK